MSTVTGWSGVDYISPDPNGGQHIVPPEGSLPKQGSDWAKRVGLHLNVQNNTISSRVHVQPIELDGWASWHNAGRPLPKAGYLTNSFVPTEPKPIEDLSPEEDDMKDVCIARIAGVGSWLYPSLTPLASELIPVVQKALDLSIVDVDDDGAWVMMSVILMRMEPAMREEMRLRYNRATEDVDIPAITTPIPAINVETPNTMDVHVKSWPSEDLSVDNVELPNG